MRLRSKGSVLRTRQSDGCGAEQRQCTHEVHRSTRTARVASHSGVQTDGSWVTTNGTERTEAEKPNATFTLFLLHSILCSTWQFTGKWRALWLRGGGTAAVWI